MSKYYETDKRLWFIEQIKVLSTIEINSGKSPDLDAENLGNYLREEIDSQERLLWDFIYWTVLDLEGIQWQRRLDCPISAKQQVCQLAKEVESILHFSPSLLEERISELLHQVMMCIYNEKNILIDTEIEELFVYWIEHGLIRKNYLKKNN